MQALGKTLYFIIEVSVIEQSIVTKMQVKQHLKSSLNFYCMGIMWKCISAESKESSVW